MPKEKQGMYWCQAKEECMHPQFAWTADGLKINMDQLDKAPTRHAQKCEEGEGADIWEDRKTVQRGQVNDPEAA